MAPHSLPLVARLLEIYIALVLCSTVVQNSTGLEPIKHNQTTFCPEGFLQCHEDDMRCHECRSPETNTWIPCKDYEGDGGDERNCCCDINECNRDPGPCGKHAICNNTLGNYSCGCNVGFQEKNASVFSCEDIDECISKPCGKGARCENFLGGYWCPCLPGYINYTETIPGGKTKFICKPFSCSAPSGNDCSDGQTFICDLKAGLETICNLSLSAQSREDKEKMLREVLNLLDEQVSSPVLTNASKKERHRKATVLMREVESSLRHLAGTLVAKPMSTESSKGTELTMDIRTPGNHSQSPASLSQKKTQMKLRWDVANSEDEAFRVIGLVSYEGLGPLLAGAQVDGNEWQAVILSKVAAAFLGHENTSSLNISVQFTFNYTGVVPPRFSSSSSKQLAQKLICAFWMPVSGGWSTEGCELLEPNGKSTQCRCNHLTSFAVLMAFYEVEDEALDVITRIGLVFSLICLFLSILTFLFCRSIRGIRTTIHLYLCLALFAAHAVFLVGIGNTANKTACAIVAALLHYFFLSAFCWMLLEGVELYLMVVQVFRTHSLKHWHHVLVGFGLPAVIVGIAAAINHKGYGTKAYCWLSMERGFLWSFLAPVCLIIMINAIVFVVTIWTLTKKFADINPDMSQLKKQKVLVITAIAQLCILGTTWIFGMFQFNNHSLVMSYIFTILNSLQGLFIFILHCLLKKQVRDDYCRLLCQRRSSKPQSSDKYSEFNSTATFNTLRPQKSPRESEM